MVGARHVGVVHVEQQAAAGALQHLAQELRLAHRRGLELEVGRRVLEQHAALQAFLHPVDVRAHAVQRAAVEGHRQQIVEEGFAVASPREVLRERCRLVAIDQGCQTVEMRLVERANASDRQPDAVQRQRVVLADAAEEVMEGPAVDHVVLGVHFEESDVRARVEHVPEVFGLQADAGASRQPGRHAAQASARCGKQAVAIARGGHWHGRCGFSFARRLRSGRSQAPAQSCCEGLSASQAFFALNSASWP